MAAGKRGRAVARGVRIRSPRDSAFAGRGDPPAIPPSPAVGTEEGEGSEGRAPEPATDGADADADAAAAEEEEEEEDDTPREGEVWGLGLSSRAGCGVRCSTEPSLAGRASRITRGAPERSMRPRLQDEVLHKERWDQLVTRTAARTRDGGRWRVSLIALVKNAEVPEHRVGQTAAIAKTS